MENRTRGANTYAYAGASPLRLKDPLGLFTIDQSCDELKCRSTASPFANVHDQIQRETTFECNSGLAYITDVGVRDCMLRRCDTP
jgi:hypothetical protein